MSPPQDTSVDGAQSPDQDHLGQTSVADKGSLIKLLLMCVTNLGCLMITGDVVDTLK